MRIVLDCRSVFPGMGGIGRSTACLARELPAALGPEHELVLLLGARRPAEPLAHGPNVCALPSEAAMIDPAFEQLRLPALLRELEADVYHGTCFAVPLAASAVARVATVHDVVFRRRPELVAGSLGEYLARWIVGEALARRLGVPFRLALATCVVERRQNRLTRDQLYLAELEQRGVDAADEVLAASPAALEGARRHYRAAHVRHVSATTPATRRTA